MAMIGRALQQVKRQLEHFVTDADVEQLCRQHDHAFRRGKLGGPAGSVHLMLLQLLAAVSLSGLRHAAQADATKQAIGKARTRLPLAIWMALARRVCPPGPAPSSLWRGLRVLVADAASCLTEDTASLSKKYGKAKNGRRGTAHGRPTPKLLAVLDLAEGFIHQVIALPWARQERACLARLFKACGAGAVLLGDRGMVGFAHLALMRAAGVEGCFRLPRWLVVSGRGKGNRRVARRLGRQDVLVTWRKTRRVGWMSRRRWDRLPAELTLRQVSFRITRRGFRTNWAWLVTTLTDPRLYPAEALVELYGKRWQIEVYFRDLKRTLKLRQTAARTAAGVRKEILAFVVLYNLVRQVMLRAAQRQGVDADRVSFADAARWLLWSEPGAAPIDLVVNPRRRRDTQPRMLKHGRRKYARLNKPRSQLAKPACEAKL